MPWSDGDGSTATTSWTESKSPGHPKGSRPGVVRPHLPRPPSPRLMSPGTDKRGSFSPLRPDLRKGRGRGYEVAVSQRGAVPLPSLRSSEGDPVCVPRVVRTFFTEGGGGRDGLPGSGGRPKGFTFLDLSLGSRRRTVDTRARPPAQPSSTDRSRSPTDVVSYPLPSSLFSSDVRRPTSVPKTKWGPQCRRKTTLSRVTSIPHPSRPLGPPFTTRPRVHS